MKKLIFLFLFCSLNVSLFAQDDVLLSAEIMPSCKSCEPLRSSPDYEFCNKKAFLEFMYDNIKYPKEARDSSVQGGLQVEFVIDKDGKLQKPKVTIGLGHGCDEEVLRVLKLMNNEPQMWLGGEHEGKGVAVRLYHFIFFKLPPSGMEMSSVKEQLIPKSNLLSLIPPFKKPQRKTNATDNNSIEEIFTVVENMPIFPGCEDEATELDKKKCTEKSLLKYMYQNITYPDLARENGIEGLVVVQFVIKKDGTVSDLNILKAIGGGCDFEVIKVMNTFNKKGMKWIPGKQKGKAVPVRYNLPIRFKLAENNPVKKN